MGFRAMRANQGSSSHHPNNLGKTCGKTITRCLWPRSHARSRWAWWITDLCKKTHKIWLWTAVDHFRSGILGWVLGDHSSETFESLWDRVSAWKCYFYVTDGWPVYPMFIPDEDYIISKTYMTRVEGENTRLRHYLARLHRKTLCYSKCAEMLRHSIKLLIHYLKFQDVPLEAVFIPWFSNARA